MNWYKFYYTGGKTAIISLKDDNEARWFFHNEGDHCWKWEKVK